ncbi:hypothetical protein A2U01_0109667, partial [Trifolium medium]|nr:hypothetical protein [Trifolium medium]
MWRLGLVSGRGGWRRRQRLVAWEEDEVVGCSDDLVANVVLQ